MTANVTPNILRWSPSTKTVSLKVWWFRNVGHNPWEVTPEWSNVYSEPISFKTQTSHAQERKLKKIKSLKGHATLKYPSIANDPLLSNHSLSGKLLYLLLLLHVVTIVFHQAIETLSSIKQAPNNWFREQTDLCSVVSVLDSRPRTYARFPQPELSKSKVCYVMFQDLVLILIRNRGGKRTYSLKLSLAFYINFEPCFILLSDYSSRIDEVHDCVTR